MGKNPEVHRAYLEADQGSRGTEIAGQRGGRVRLRQSSGFTLVELLVVLLIAGLLLAGAQPIFSSVVSGARLRSAARELAADFRAVQGAAVEQRQEAAMLFDLPNKTYTLTTDVRPRQLPSDLDLVVKTTVIGDKAQDKAIIRFFADGTSTGARVDLGRGANHCVVEVNWLTGRVWIDG
jgi:general secretion pathway protein H